MVLPMQKTHRRVMLHYLQGIINSPDQMSVLVNMDADVLLFVMTEATIGCLYIAAHNSGERREIALAVVAVQDNNTRIMWERVFVLL